MNNNFKRRMAQDTELERLRQQASKRRGKSEKGINICSYIASAICVVIAVIFFVYKSPLLGGVFLGLALLLTLVVWLSVKVEDKERKDKENLDK